MKLLFPIDRLKALIGFYRRFSEFDAGLMAAAVAYNAFFALVPASFALIAAASFFGRDAVTLARSERILRDVVPADVAQFIVDVLDEVGDTVGNQQGWFIAISVLIALWSGSRGVVAFQKALARIEKHEEDRSGVVRRLVGIGLTVGAGVTIVVVSYAVVVGTAVIDFLVEFTGSELLGTLSVVIAPPLAALGLYSFLYAALRWGPPEPYPHLNLGALAGTMAIGVTSVAYGVVLNNFSLGTTFGVLGAVAFTLLWMYLTIYAVLFTAAAVGFGFEYRAGQAETATIVPSGDSTSAPPS